MRKYLDDTILPRLDTDWAEYVDADITVQEVKQAITSLKPNKRPGPDGYTAIFYKKLIDVVAPHLTTMYNSIKVGNRFDPESLSAAIVMIPKPGKDPLAWQNYHPISLLNLDLKILGKIIAARINTSLSSLIHSDQVGFVPGRQSSDGVRRITQLIEAAKSTQPDVMLLSLDMEKAFDCFSWDYLMQALDRWGFGQGLKTWVSAMYHEPTAKVKYSGFESASHSINRGTRQGCPLSPILFILALELLASNIRHNQAIRGIYHGKEEHKLSMFADDMLLTISSPHITAPNLASEMEAFSNMSGLRINAGKSLAMGVSLSQQTNTLLKGNFPWLWVTKLPYLGVTLTASYGALYKANYPGLFNQLKLLPTSNGEQYTHSFLLEVFNILFSYIKRTFNRNCKVLDFHHPHQLLEGLEGFNLALSEQPEPLEQLLVDCRDTLKYGVKTAHPRYFNQLSSGLDIVGLAGEWLTATANTNMFTFEVAPVFTIMEDILIRKMHELVGWKDMEADGTFSPGGAIANLYSVLAARYKCFPVVKTKGMAALPRIVLFTSEHSHYSFEKASAALGIGTENVIVVRCDDRGKMIPSDLEKKIVHEKEKGNFPFYVSATSGTTVYGAFDPLSKIADICEKYGLWMHVDAAWGGGLLLSKKHRHKLDAIERANSVTWNPHKIMGIPLQCSAILLREKGLLQACNQLCADYLFQPDKPYDVAYDTGDKTIQCGRHVDVFKLWLMWKAKGTCGFELQINKCLENAEYLYNKVKMQKNFELVFADEPEHTNVCFWYIPPSLQDLSRSIDWSAKLHKVAPKIKARMMEDGTLMVNYQPLKDRPNFFRVVFSNSATKKSDIDFLLDEIERLGKDLGVLINTGKNTYYQKQK
ncbi:glutamate decarboxylase 1-like [Gastrophryne carolinensis]